MYRKEANARTYFFCDWLTDWWYGVSYTVWWCMTTSHVERIIGPTNPVKQSGATDEEHSVLQRIPHTATTATAMHQGWYCGCPEGCAGTTIISFEIFILSPLPFRARSGTHVHEFDMPQERKLRRNSLRYTHMLLCSLFRLLSLPSSYDTTSTVKQRRRHVLWGRRRPPNNCNASTWMSGADWCGCSWATRCINRGATHRLPPLFATIASSRCTHEIAVVLFVNTLLISPSDCWQSDCTRLFFNEISMNVRRHLY